MLDNVQYSQCKNDENTYKLVFLEEPLQSLLKNWYKWRAQIVFLPHHLTRASPNCLLKFSICE